MSTEADPLKSSNSSEGGDQPAPSDPHVEKPAAEEPIDDSHSDAGSANEEAKPAQSGPKITGRPVARAMKADSADRPRRRERENENEEDRDPKSKPGERATKDRESERVNRQEEESEEERPTRNRRYRDEHDDSPARGKKQGGGGAGVIIAIVCGGLFFCCLGVGGAIYYVVQSVRKGAEEWVENLTPKNDKVTSANYQKLKLLMTRSEVEAILGPGQPTTASEIQLAFHNQQPAQPLLLQVWQRKLDDGEVLIWRNNGDYMLVALHAKSTGRVQFKAFLPKNGRGENAGIGDEAQFARMLAQEDHPPGGPTNTPPIGPKTEPMPVVKEENPPPGPLVEVTAEELAQAYKDNESAANTKYKDQWLLVEGKILDVTSGPPDAITKTDTTMVKLVGVKLPRNRGDFAVWGHLRPDASSGGWELTRGQTVKLKGKCTGGSTLRTYVDLQHCRIDSYGPDPSLNATAGGLITEFLKNTDTANEKYRDKEVTISNAVLESISGDLAIFAPSSKKSTIKLQVRFTGTPLKTLQELKPGSRVKFKARCGGRFGDKIANYDAYLVP